MWRRSVNISRSDGSHTDGGPVADIEPARGDAAAERLKRLNAPVQELAGDAIAAAEAACGVGSVFADAGDYFSGRRPSFRATIFVDFGVFHENPTIAGQIRASVV
jgi:hypothetical protein